jgi:putative OPT family oligopeptide transporter
MSIEPNRSSLTDGGLPAEAYRPLQGGEYKPYVPADNRSMAEFTLRAGLLGVVLGIVFAAANAYLGLKVGMTVTASIPVSVISMAILRGLLKNGTILENNMVQTIGSSGESLAAGIIFTVPALIMMGVAPGLGTMFMIAGLGGILGILMMIPLRRWLMVKEHGHLPYPEGTGCAEVLVAGEEGGSKARSVFAGLAVGFLYKLGMDRNTFALWSDAPELALHKLRTAVGMDALPSLVGVGFIIGPRIAATMLGGGMLAWLVLIPLIAVFGDGLDQAIYPSTSTLISAMEPGEIWSKYIRYIGAGAVTVCGLISLGRNLPAMLAGLKGLGGALGGGRSNGSAQAVRTDRDLPLGAVLLGCLGVALLLWLIPGLHLGLAGALLTVVFTFFFTVVASRVVGLVGGSSLPVSGMTISALLGTSLVFVGMGFEGMAAKVAALTVGAVVCVAISTAGDISQDLKTGFLIGATPRRQQLGELIGVLSSAVFIGLILNVLHAAFVIGSDELPAPQATLMRLVVEGVMDGNLPWTLVFTGAAIGVVIELLGVAGLPFAVGLYLPLSLSTPIMVGGLIRALLEHRTSLGESRRKQGRESGVLLASGLIAGEAVLGIFIALFIVLRDRMGWGLQLAIPHPWGAGMESLLGFLMLMGLALWFTRRVMRA